MAKRISVKGPIVGNDVGWFYHYFGWDCCCPNDISEGLMEAGGEDVILEINSPGGYCDMGSEIYTMLMEYEGKVTAHIMSAASAASVIACAADEVLMSDTAVYMIHNSRGGASGDYRDMINCAEALGKYNEAIVNAYVRKTGKKREELYAMMNHTTWMSAADAIEHGFADDYLFGNPEEGQREDEDTVSDGGSFAAVASSTVFPIISSEKALEFRKLIELSEAAASFDCEGGKKVLKKLLEGSAESTFLAENSSDADSDKVTENPSNHGEGGNESMPLKKILEENLEAKAEVESLLGDARREGAEAENSRMKELDSISASVTPERLFEAKYGEKRLDAKTLAFEALVEDGKKAEGYMMSAVKDSQDANVDAVGSNLSDPEEPVDESGAYADYINKLHAGR